MTRTACSHKHSNICFLGSSPMLASAASLLPYIQQCPQPPGLGSENPPETSQGGRRQRRQLPKGCVHGGVGWGWAGAGKAPPSLRPLDREPGPGS